MSNELGMVINDDMYWSCHNLMSRDGMWNFADGARGLGKTYDSVRFGIKRYLAGKGTFIYLRRYKSELKEREAFFKNMISNNEFPEHEFRVHGMQGQIRKSKEGQKDSEGWETLMYFHVLSTAISKKGVPYPDVTLIIFDEFIIDKSKLFYMADEFTAFMDFYLTVDRYKDKTRVLFLANACSIRNPYYMALNITPSKKEFTKYNDGYVWYQHISNELFTEFVNTTRFGKFIAGTSYYDFAVGNEFSDNNDKFIRQRPSGAEYYFGVTYRGDSFGIWTHGLNYYVTGKVRLDMLHFALTKDDMTLDTVMVEKSHDVLKTLVNIYRVGRVFFDKPNTRAVYMEILDYLGIR